MLEDKEFADWVEFPLMLRCGIDSRGGKAKWRLVGTLQ